MTQQLESEPKLRSSGRMATYGTSIFWEKWVLMRWSSKAKVSGEKDGDVWPIDIPGGRNKWRDGDVWPHQYPTREKEGRTGGLEEGVA
jgi:hypothetical protein